MVRENRIKTYTFPIGSLTANSDGNISSYSDHPINGTIVKVGYEVGDVASNGSICLQVSGTGEILWKYLNAVASQTDYLQVPTVNNIRTGSGIGIVTQPAVGGYDGQLWVWGSGCGDTKKASGLTIFYI